MAAMAELPIPAHDSMEGSFPSRDTTATYKSRDVLSRQLMIRSLPDTKPLQHCLSSASAPFRSRVPTTLQPFSHLSALSSGKTVEQTYLSTELVTSTEPHGRRTVRPLPRNHCGRAELEWPFVCFL